MTFTIFLAGLNIIQLRVHSSHEVSVINQRYKYYATTVQLIPSVANLNGEAITFMYPCKLSDLGSP